MSNVFIKNLIRFISLTLTQIFLLQNVMYYHLSTPLPYILFILLLPIKTPNQLLFLLSFVLGLTIDVFYDTIGLHATACTLVGLVRILFLTLTLRQDKYDSIQTPTLGTMGFKWFFFYASTLTLFHHTILFLFETFNFSELFHTLLRAIGSSVFTVILILVYEYMFFSKKVH